MAKILLVIFLGIVGLTLADHGHHEHIDVHYHEGFEADKGLGVWYVIKKGPNLGVDEFAEFECFEEHYSKNLENDFVIDYAVHFRHKQTGNLSVQTGFATIDPKKPYKMTFFFLNRVYKAFIVATDYNKWSVGGTIFEKPDGTLVPIYWILSRKQTLDKQILDTIETFLGVPPADYISYNHENCPKQIQFASALPGGTSREEKPATQVIQDLVKRISPSIKEKIEMAQSGASLKSAPEGSDLFQAISYRTQIVSGKNYFIKVKVLGENDNKIWHLRIYEHWSGSPIEVVKVIGPKPEEHPLEYFD